MKTQNTLAHLFILPKENSNIQKEKTKMKKCDYCGNECDESFFRTLDNGSEACFNCAKDEEKSNESRSETNKEKEKENEK